MMNIQWYPGHMTKAKRMMQEDIKLIDIVIELLDARAPLSSKNPDIDNLATNKSRMVILNKADMADARKTAKWEEYFKAKGFFVLSMDSRKNSGMKPVSDTIREACKEKIARDRKRGIINRPIRAMIVGIPNVGKSTFINSYVNGVASGSEGTSLDTVMRRNRARRSEISRVLRKESSGFALARMWSFLIHLVFCGQNLMIRRLACGWRISVPSTMKS